MTKILLVDDSAIDRRLFAELLEKESDFNVESCNDGKAALEAMSVSSPDVVLTDMQMPEMDGLELVTRIREEHSDVPVILITGHGSEGLATKALRAGAAGYVPKSHSSEVLVDTVQHVLALANSDHIDDSIHSTMSLIHYELELTNDELMIPKVLQLVRKRLEDCTSCDSADRLQIEVALEHAIQNAIYHGNLEFEQYAQMDFGPAEKIREARLLNQRKPYCDRRVHVVIHITQSEARFVVRDEGRGFDVKEISSLGLTHSLRGEFGHGLFLMWAFMDKVVFDKTGTSVTLLKRLEAEPDELQTVEDPDAVEKPRVLLNLVPEENARPLEVLKTRVTLGRDASCDVVINSSNVSHHHCLLFLHEGWWFVRDLKSKNGIKVNGKPCEQHLVPPAAVLSVGKHDFTVEYQPYKLGAVGITPPIDPF